MTTLKRLKQALVGSAMGGALVAFAMLAPLPAVAQSIFKPVAVVNDSAITGFDIAQRARIFDTLGADLPSADALRQQALNSLIEERLKVQAATQIGIERSPEVVQTGLDEFAQQFSETGAELRTRLQAAGATNQAIDDFVSAEVLWREVVRARFLRRAEPSEAAIDAEIDLRNTGRVSALRLRELGIQFTGDEAGDLAIREKIIDIYQAVQGGADFEAAVRANSTAPSAANGGDMGWVEASVLPPRLVQTLANLPVGQVSRPLTREDGVTLLQVLEKRRQEATDVTATPEEREQIRRLLVGETINRLADGFLQELRRDALIEIR